jgi:hypothetical protein
MRHGPAAGEAGPESEAGGNQSRDDEMRIQRVAALT